MRTEASIAGSLGQARCGLVADEDGRVSGLGAEGAVIIEIFSVSVITMLRISPQRKKELPRVFQRRCPEIPSTVWKRLCVIPRDYFDSCE